MKYISKDFDDIIKPASFSPPNISRDHTDIFESLDNVLKITTIFLWQQIILPLKYSSNNMGNISSSLTNQIPDILCVNGVRIKKSFKGLE